MTRLSLGYSTTEVASELGISNSLVLRRLAELRDELRGFTPQELVAYLLEAVRDDRRTRL